MKSEDITYVDDQGYLRFINSDIYVHRWVAGKKYGKDKIKDKHVHHLDGNKQNNKPENLILLEKEDHFRIEEYNKLKLSDSNCSVCGNEMIKGFVAVEFEMKFSKDTNIKRRGITSVIFGGPENYKKIIYNKSVNINNPLYNAWNCNHCDRITIDYSKPVK